LEWAVGREHRSELDQAAADATSEGAPRRLAPAVKPELQSSLDLELPLVVDVSGDLVREQGAVLSAVGPGVCRSAASSGWRHR
jgi:hypothetical protein